jgi:DNA anti-recombination protein RmuC
LVNELKQMLTELVTAQTHVAKTHNQALTDSLKKNQRQMTEKLSSENERVATAVSDALRDSLNPAMNEISRAVGALGAQRGEQVQGLLSDMLVGFLDRLQETLGQQMKDVSVMVQANADTMRTMRDELTAVVGNLTKAGTTICRRRHRAQLPSLGMALPKSARRQRSWSKRPTA